ncbi:DUF2126 domain-containing protein [Thioalkalivibrio sulfidiphilus]|uniref:transglutaminase family protein n=1 Tax=Thioalkalivibrio sulfidiphilus TaxID=1033854 RepID=UPI00036E62FB|nr:transglutaminase family protein [Thioalkalivibrio sulfidiphilus]
MAIRVALNHRTVYRFDRRVRISPHVIRLRPAVHTRTPILSYSLDIQPKEHFINWQQDPFGNLLARVVFPEAMRELSVTVDLVAEMTVINPFDFFVEKYAETFPFEYDGILAKELIPYLEITDRGPLLMGWLEQVKRDERGIVDFLVDLNRRLHQDIAYSVRMEPGVQSCEETLTRRIGSCRDSAWLLVQILRHLGLAARFVSGYLVQLTADEKSLDGPSGPEADFTDLHAWTEVFVPGAGWIGLDPTSGLFAGEGHIPLACTPSPLSAAPITGYTEVCEVAFEHENRVSRIHEDPRVTKPYSDDQWAAIDALGRKVDQDLLDGDVRLTMGGEPTFVSIDDMEAAEWNTRADGPHKRRLARELAGRLLRRFGPGGMFHHGQGKWYPGEPLPRWSLGCFWRKDGEPVWRDPAWLADISRDYGHGRDQALAFARELAHHLGVPENYLVPGYEDPLYYLWREGNEPVNRDPLKADLKSPAERRRLARILSQGLDEPVGYALPLTWDHQYDHWRSGVWAFRRGRLFLIPGDSPMGLRLPLDSLPWVAPAQRDEPQAPSLFEARPELGDYFGEVTRRYSERVAPEDPRADTGLQPQAPGDDPDDTRWAEVPHTSLCVEAREGRLHVFLPPLNFLEHYLDLVSAVEATATKLKLPVVLEGYEPPRDNRLERLLVTPDPGVIEVNIHPAASWERLRDNTLALYEEARQSRLGTEKFMLDGRHTGTGGGNHVTLGAATPVDSPLLRRPDLLGSLVSFWQHHPGLSYLFSGMFIGPTSQAPRIDEARNESLYELEIALSQLPQGEEPRPWLVDRLFRNLLVDITGNTHRAEFCIDKLYSPDSPTGRLGLLELRAFEMPPHARMSLVQMLLLRALVACFWREPYRHRLVRWGTALHDRFMLPHFVERDMAQVVEHLNRAGYPFQADWLTPFSEFRFPHYGRVNIGDIQIELRMALEPWHVLGEEVTTAGTARYVDSSVERLQVRVTGLTEGRYVLACNGRRVPLQSTGTHGEYVAGVRYRAWQPPSALHPNIGVHAPLVFDLIDTWNGRAIGGCTYHVSHPGGRNYDVFPVNAFEAEARRITRFWDHGHTPGTLQPPPALRSLAQFHPEGSLPGPMAPPTERPDPEYPCTLDLRRPPLA